ncbi:hypothetical protein [Nocardia sputorum]|uniref:hypothetical protein n=1 Tax=Nocardia sputorum TaxID=2984338 RepID=UPI00249251C1|nr:hypothetical protein [Nocardia sputorum]
MAFGDITMTRTDEPTPDTAALERHQRTVTRMSTSRGSLLTALLGPTELLAPRHQEVIDHTAQNIEFALWRVALVSDTAESMALYHRSRIELTAVLTCAGITAAALNAINMLLTDWVREAELLATHAPAPEPVVAR